MSKIKIIKTLQKMMRHERSARLIGNVGEADRYAEKIAEMRAKYNITQEITLEAEDQSNPFDIYGGEAAFTPDSPLFRRKRVFWEEALFEVICRYFNCHSLIIAGTNLRIAVGEKSDRASAIKSYLFLTGEACREAERYLKSLPETLSIKEKNLFKNSFFFGFGFIVSQRLQLYKHNEYKLALLQTSTGEVPERIKQSEALVIKEKIEISEQRKAVEQEISEMDAAPCENIEFDGEAFSAGTEAGAKVSLNDEIALPAKQVNDDLIEIREKVRRKTEKQRSWFWNGCAIGVDYGKPGEDTTVSSVYQMPLIFDENE